jgi:arylsulfatase A
VWFHEPHGPINSDPKFLDRYKVLNDPSLRQYFANVTQIDEAVGAIVKSLKTAGVYDETCIWYTSDNGPEGKHQYGTFNKSDSPYGGSRSRGSTAGLKGRKRHTHEGGIRVPGIISWPNGFKRFGRKPGNVCGEPVIGSDVFPTMLDIAGIAPPAKVTLDGTSILPLLQDKPFKRPKPLYWRNTQYKFQIALMDGDWKLVGTSKRTAFELYNLRIDPRETTNLAPHHPERFERMKQALIAYDKEVLAEGPKWWKRQKNIAITIPAK